MRRIAAWTLSLALVLAACDQSVYESCGDEGADLLRPAPGEVTIIQLRLNGSVKHGEAAIVVGPDGALVLLDVGNSNHSGEVREAVRSLNTRCLTPENGYTRERAALEVDWVVLTHFHGDHAGGLEELLVDDPPLEVTRGIVHRGYTDVGSGLNQGTFASVCRLLRDSHADLDVPLCGAAVDAPCDADAWTTNHESIGCDGLLSVADDDDGRRPAHLDLGGDARLVFVAAAGFVSDGEAVARAPTFGYDENNEENARSLVGLVAHGPFRYHFGGDLTGEGVAGVPDMETPLAEIAGPYFYGPMGVDVIHAHHHVRRTSSHRRFVDMVAPMDGLSRNVVGGIAAHVGSPHSEVLARFGDDDRLGDGQIWTTRSATGGDEHPRLLDADAAIVVATVDGGRAYFVETSRADGATRARFDAVRRP